MRYSRPGESIFARAKIDLSLNYFRSGEGYFRPGKIGLAQAKKNFFFGFLFSII